jgi:hypothetical protein
MKGGESMVWLLVIVVVLLLIVIGLLILMIKRDPNFGKEFGEAMLAMWTSAKDGRLTAEEKATIKKEWRDVDWKAAFKAILKL